MSHQCCNNSDKDDPRPSARNCDIRGQEDDLSCRPNGEVKDKLWILASDIVGLGVVCAIYKLVSS